MTGYFTDSKINQLHDELASQNIYTLLDHSPNCDPDTNYDILESCIIATMDRVIPIKKVKIHKYKHKKSPWITFGIIKSIKFKDKLYRSLKQLSPDTPPFLTSKHNLRIYKGILNTCIRKAKKNYYYSNYNGSYHVERQIHLYWRSYKSLLCCHCCTFYEYSVSYFLVT